MVSVLDEILASIRKIMHEKRAKRNERLGLSRKQSILLDFEDFGECFEHKRKKTKVANKLKKEGKTVFIEKPMKIAGIKIRPDVCYFENGKLNIVEIEHRGCHTNNTIKNRKKLAKYANITIIDIPSSKFCLHDD